MTKLNEYAFRELINTTTGHIIISYDTLDDFRMKVDMIEADSYKDVHTRLENAMGGISKTVKTSYPDVDTGPDPEIQNNRHRHYNDGATKPENGPDPKEVESVAKQFPSVEEYLESLQFAVSETAPYPIAYFRTIKHGKVKEGYLNVNCNDDGLWNMNKWLKKNGKQIDFDDTWPMEYRFIMEVIDAIDRRIKIMGE